MGYRIEQRETNFTMSHENYKKAFIILRKEMSHVLLDCDLNSCNDLNDLMILHGWELDVVQKDYKEINIEEIEDEVSNMVNTLTIARHQVMTNEQKNKILETVIDIGNNFLESVKERNRIFIKNIENTTDFLDDSYQLFDIIAPYVDDGSYIECKGEDGEIWRFSFENGEMVERKPKIIWE